MHQWRQEPHVTEDEDMINILIVTLDHTPPY